MVITFVSNYLNHHQLPFSKAMYAMEDVDYTFLQTEEMELERKNMGWSFDPEEYPFFKEYYKDPDRFAKLIMDSDVVIFGGTDDENYIMPRLEAGKFVIRYSERIYKDGQWKFISPRGLIKKYHDHVRFKENVYLLCSGAYVASDFSLIHAYKDRMLTWGYFPEFIEYGESTLDDKRIDNNKVNILWCGRQIDWKHPEYVLELAIALKKKAYDVHITMVGDGEMNASLKDVADELELDEMLTFKPFIEPEKVRDEMLMADIFLFTSDYHEGWGAVLNEAMNSGCAVVASSGIGAVPYLVQHNINGMVYRNGDLEEMINCVMQLIYKSEHRRELGLNAYRTIRDRWNAFEAADRLMKFIRGLQDGEANICEDGGPVCVAPNLPPKLGYEYTHMHEYMEEDN